MSGETQKFVVQEIARHQARQDEIKDQGENEGDRKPPQLLYEIPGIAFHDDTSTVLSRIIIFCK